MLPAAVGLGWWILRGDGPEAVDLETAVARLEEESADASDGGGDAAAATTSLPAETASSTTVGAEVSTASSVASVEVETTESVVPSTTVGVGVSVTTLNVPEQETPPTPVTVPETVPSVAQGLIGTWVVVTTEGAEDLTGASPVSLAGYRVVEVLVGGVGETEVVGRTSAVSGSIELTESALVAASVEVEMGTVRTDDSHRDSHMRQSLETKEFPLTVFTLVEPLELSPEVFEGETFSGEVMGDLTIKGVTQPAVFNLDARLVDETIVAVGSSRIVFADYGVSVPNSANVISVEDHGVIEFQLYFTADRDDREAPSSHPAEGS